MNILARTYKDGIAYTPTDWHLQVGITFDIEIKNFSSLKEFRLWAIDPELKYLRKHKCWDVFWISAAIRILGIDIQIGWIYYPEQEVNLKGK
ncbi:MAG: hypothetical protein COA84_14000 [Robiginitomaculum sp.]|nr:MAG: hypothetical protein COA84_14000 [Robiginitomaculum sp.]